jgi:hypothetical protein
MERHDPLSAVTPPAEISAPVPVAPKKGRRLPPLLREAAQIKDDTLAFLYGGPEQQPSDYERNLERAGKIRGDFVQFCTANSYFSNWRQAWAAFMHNQPDQPAPESISEPRYAVAVKTPAIPRWKQRLYHMARP